MIAAVKFIKPEDAEAQRLGYASMGDLDRQFHAAIAKYEADMRREAVFLEICDLEYRRKAEALRRTGRTAA
jgi:hypothetical protein